MRIIIYLCGVVVSLVGACVATERVDVSAAALTACPDAGAGEVQSCLFGEVFSDIRTSPVLTLDSERWIRSVEELDPLVAEQLLIAVQQSSHSDVVTPAEALERVDQQEVRQIAFRDSASERAFVVYEYGVGDNSYGAYFASDSSEVLASIHDGDILDCSVLND
jgi:hypothetical protein